MAETDASLVEKANQWLEWDTNEATRKEVQQLLDAKDNDELAKRFTKRIAFGTAGLRGVMRAGISSMNVLTVTQATQGLAMYVLEKFGEEATKKGVCIGYDGRHNSLQFAHATAATFASKNIPVYLFNRLVPTPFVPYCILRKGLCAGVMVTASHNPKDDNGYKVYWNNGCQIVAPIDKAISDSIEANLPPWNVDVDSLIKSDLIIDETDEVSSGYYEDISKKLCWHREANRKSDVKMVFTPMHGVGNAWAIKAFESFDLPPFTEVPEQKDPDPEFSTVKFPNPEEGKGALKLAMVAADKAGADVIIANDPDSDRLAAAERLPSGEWKIFAGNEIGIILAHWTWVHHAELWRSQGGHAADAPVPSPDTFVMLNTTVSSKMLSAMAEKEGFKYEETLTGFKWLGSVAERKAKEGANFLFAFEEAIGYMVGDICLDKDGIRAAAIFGEMVNHLKVEHNRTLTQQLQWLYERYGSYVTNNRYFFCYESAKMRAIFKRIRSAGTDGSYLRNIGKDGKFKVKHIRDLTTGFDDTQADNKAILPVSPSSEMITFHFENGMVCTLRGSGTEPKLKYYCELHGDSMESVRETLNEMVQAVIDDYLQPEVNELVAPMD